MDARDTVVEALAAVDVTEYLLAALHVEQERGSVSLETYCAIIYPGVPWRRALRAASWLPALTSQAPGDCPQPSPTPHHVPGGTGATERFA